MLSIAAISSDRSGDWKRRKRKPESVLAAFALIGIGVLMTGQDVVADADASASEKSRYRTEYACEGEALKLQCEPETVIHLIRVNYGRFSLTVCNDHGRTDMSVNCMSQSSLRILHSQCSNRRECVVPANSTLFGDPCQGTDKYLVAHYQCLPEELGEVQHLSDIKVAVNRPNLPSTPTTLPPISSTIFIPKPPPALKPTPSTTTTTTTRRTPPSTTSTPSTYTLIEKDASEQKSIDAYEVHRPDAADVLDVVTSSPGSVAVDARRPRCPRLIDDRGVIWPDTQAGLSAQMPCPGFAERGTNATWKCGLKYGNEDPDTQQRRRFVAWENKRPNYSACRSQWLVDLKEELSVAKGLVSVTAVVTTLATEMEHKARSMFGSDLETLANLWLQLSKEITEMDPEMTTSDESSTAVKSVLQAVNEIFSPKSALAWKEVSDDSGQTLTRVMEAVEAVTQAFSERAGSPLNIDLEYIQASSVPLRSETESIDFPDASQAATFGWGPELEPVDISFNPSSVSGQSQGVNTVVFIIYELSAEAFVPNLVTPSSVLHTREDGNSSFLKLNSKVVSVSVGSNSHSIHLSSPISITFKNIRVGNRSNPVCVFWSYKPSGWSTDGCRAEFWNSTHTQCSCDHLTPFAVLVDVNDVTLEHGHFVALTVITIVGCVVSIVALVAAVLTFAFMPSLKCDRTTIHKNLCICLLVAEVIFLAGIDATSHRVLCGVVAGLLHYFFLAAFCWMFCEGFQIYVLLVEVFQSERKRVGLYYWASYGLPLVVVGAAAAVDAESYGTPAHCWLRTDNYFAMSFFGPVLLVIACNLVFLAMGVFVVCRHFSVSASSKEQTRLSAHGKRENVEENAITSRLPIYVQRLQGALAMVVLLGLTWTFGFMHVNEKTFVMAYVFTILNSLQGFFIFYFTCLRNEKVRRQYRRLFCPGSRDRSSASHGEDESMCCLRWCCKKRSSPGSCSAELSCDKDSEPRCIAGFGNAYSGVEFRLHQPNANNSAGMNNKQYQHAHGRDEPCSRGCRPSTESRSTRSSGFTSCSVSSGVGAPPTAVFNKSQEMGDTRTSDRARRSTTGEAPVCGMGLRQQQQSADNVYSEIDDVRRRTFADDADDASFAV